MLSHGQRLRDHVVPTRIVNDIHVQRCDDCRSSDGCADHHGHFDVRIWLVPVWHCRGPGRWVLPQRLRLWYGELYPERNHSDGDSAKRTAQ
ncbi:hypothetical protein LQW54_002122 [Pestalotiopsis sp. IQ-011]